MQARQRDEFKSLGPQRGTGLHCEEGNYTFRSTFCSGNLLRVQQVDDYLSSNLRPRYQLWIAPDCVGTPFQNQYCIWYYFSAECTGEAPPREGQCVTMELMNLNKVAKSFSHDLNPVYRVGETGVWRRLASSSSSVVDGDCVRVSFSYTFTRYQKRVYFAFNQPYSYSDLQNLLASLDRRYMSPIGDARATEGTSAAPNDDQSKTQGQEQNHLSDIYYNRELLVRSVDGLRVDLLTITSKKGMLRQTEDARPGLFPEDGTRPNEFAGKTGVMITARVHPGEAPASYMLSGILGFLFDTRDPKAQLLRDAFVFKIIPMLNPDGVRRGHYRCDSLGVNLNRAYRSPNPIREPSIYGAKQVMRQMRCKGEATRTDGLAFFIDLHAYASRSSCYALANPMPMQASCQAEHWMFARL